MIVDEPIETGAFKPCDNLKNANRPSSAGLWRRGFPDEIGVNAPVAEDEDSPCCRRNLDFSEPSLMIQDPMLPFHLRQLGDEVGVLRNAENIPRHLFAGRPRHERLAPETQ